MFSFDTPSLGAAAMGDELSVLRLIRSRRVGPTTFHRLVAEYGSAAAALDALPRIAAEAGVKGYEPCPEGVAQAELAAGMRAGARLIRLGDPDYPALLATLADAPPVLWVRGRTVALHAPAVAVIGARNASSLGLRMARGLARGLAESGLVVAAGLARGIDTAAHDASCAAGTVAVMAGGIDVIYPPENRALADRICETGCLLTEQPPGVEPVARHFPARNRIVSGLSAAVVVVEAAWRSGSLITARLAGEQGREVMAVPGHPMDARASGCNALIRDGATLVRNAEDVLAALNLAGWSGAPSSAKTLPRNTDTHEDRAAAAPRGRSRGDPQPRKDREPGIAAAPGPAAASDATGTAYPAHMAGEPLPVGLGARLLALLGPSPTDENSLIRELGIPAARLAPELLSLELDGTIIRLPGGRLALA